MAKIVLAPVTNTNTISTINANFAEVVQEFQDKVFYRDNPPLETNTVTNTLDLDGNDVINGGEGHFENLFIDGVPIDEFVGADAIQAALDAEAARDAAIIAKNQAQGFATNAGTQASSAALSASNAAASAAAAAGAVAAATPGILASADTASKAYTDGKVTIINSQFADLADQTNDAKGATLIGFDLAGAVGAVPLSVRTALSAYEVNARWFGMLGDGVTNDTAAFQNAVTYCASTGKTLFIPSGLYVLSTAISATGRFSMRGESKTGTVLRWTSGSASQGLGIVLTSSGGFGTSCSITNLTFATLTALSTSSALSIVGDNPTASDRVTSRVVIRDVVIKGATHPTVDGFNWGIYLNNCTNSLVDSYTFIGKVTVVEPNYASASALLYKNDTGASPHPVGLSVQNSFIQYAVNGIDTFDFEGCLINNCQIIGVSVGVNFDGPNTFPHASVFNTHINAATTCVRISRMYEVLVHGCVLYNELGAFSGMAVQLTNGASFASILGNIVENLKPSNNMNGIVVESGSTANMISNNIIRRANGSSGSPNGVGIWFQAGGNNNLATYNLFNSTATSYLNSASGNTIV